MKNEKIITEEMRQQFIDLVKRLDHDQLTDLLSYLHQLQGNGDTKAPAPDQNQTTRQRS